jgi:hypothetical protein
MASRILPTLPLSSLPGRVFVRIVTTLPGCALGLCLVLTAVADEPDRTPTYTNDDLHRVSSRRGETGVLSRPSQPDGARKDGASRTERAASAKHSRDDEETYWRGEAERLHDRVRSLRQRADELRLRIQQQERQQRRGNASARRSPSSSRSDPAEALRQRLQSIEDEIGDREARFEERARRAGALPGWLR